MTFVSHGPDPSVFDTSNRKPHVIIIGAGLAGESLSITHERSFDDTTSLTLAVLLQKADIHYNVFEKSPQTRNVGVAMKGENGVHVKFSDGSEFEGDILVGADGAYSAVRQCLFDRLKKDRRLPASDAKELPFSCVSVAGYTGPLDPEKFPFLKEEESSVINNRSDEKPYSWNVYAVNDDKMCWSCTLYLDEESSKFHSSFRTTDWGEGGTDSMCKDVRDFPIPGGDGTLTLGDLIDKTPKDQMAKVMLEEKVFDTWYHCRTVLLGDSCHKLHPAGRQGATMAFHDAVALANWINALPTTQVKDLEEAFKAYRNERQHVAQRAEGHSKQFCKFYGKANDRSASITRYIYKNMPFLIWKVVTKKIVANRPQASFLPYVKDNGSVSPADLESFRETLKIIHARAAAAAKEEAAKKVNKNENNVPAGEENIVATV
ncbi:hypothetical protein BGZ95_011601 [Linnemannia exigua]|uniref:FAD-binding domain-containing protein n=1 Tax=Linnemannia exigua TaxID=604196 RepID=A0AAD4H452_9FUNG|nr:hypothetical protein BGZ95_011601 [Linnemannia exigua]